jgi:formyltetrahydrofolate deformylase
MHLNLTSPSKFVLTLTCEDRRGLVAAIATQLASIDSNIMESHQHRDSTSSQFFMRLAFTAPASVGHDTVVKTLKSVTDRFEIKFELIDPDRKPRIIIMVSKCDHALVHLLYQIRIGWLNAAMVASYPITLTAKH